MNKKHGILIRADTHTVNDVHSAVWNGSEIRKKLLLLHAEEIVFSDFRDDPIALIAAVNANTGGEPVRADGFEIFGKRYYGNALIIPDEGRNSPRSAPENVAHLIRFFRIDEEAETSGMLKMA